MNKSSEYRYIAIDGLDNCIETLKEIINNNLDNCFIEMSACSGSCINGPASSHNKALRISSMNKVESIALNECNPTDFDLKYSIDTSRRITDEQVVVQSPSDREISSILRKMGKNSIQDELNCGTCGYSTCREKAIAVILGKAEISMCLPYMKEKAESFSDAVIREVFEETGLEIECPQLCGVKQWHQDDGSRYVVFCYKTNRFKGNLISSEEGEVSWVKLEDMPKMKLARGMEYMLKLFLEDDISEHCFRNENGQWVNVLK